MDAIFYRDRLSQYDMKCVNRELIKAYASFLPQKVKREQENNFGIATGNWGCGAFNGDRQLKGIHCFSKSSSFDDNIKILLANYIMIFSKNVQIFCTFFSGQTSN